MSSKEVVLESKNSSTLALPADMLAELAKEAKEASAKERPAIGRISLQSGVMSYMGAPMKDNKMEAIILTAGYRNVWYVGKFNRDTIVNPNCYALALDADNMAPDAALVREPAHATCAGCQYDEWGSDPGGGKGKACKQSRRLVLMPAGVLDAEDPVAAIKTAELAVLDLPVTSVKNYSGFVNALAASAGVPIYAAVTEVRVAPDAKTQFKVHFAPMRVAPNAAVLSAIRTRLGSARDIALQPYEDTALLEDLEAVPATPAKKPSKKF